MAFSSSHSHSSNYAVFLSFRGEDTRKTFVDHFYTNLMNRGILTYKDDVTLRQGECISPSLFNAIERSQIALPIFSENYASSSWCLEELTHIMKCKDEGKLIVIPIFYGVVPSEVRKQEGDFGKGFAKQEARNINKVDKWRNALIRACEIAGWDIKNMANGHESKAMNQIVDKISEMVVPVTLDVDEYLVGMGARVQEMIAKLEMASDGVRMIGIWGGCGIGKTTLASSLSREISSFFEGHCTLEDISEESNKHGLIPLQKKIISTLLKKEVEFEDVDIGKCYISVILHHQDEKGWRSFLDRIENPPITYEGLKSELKELRSDISSFFRRHMGGLWEIFED